MTYSLPPSDDDQPFVPNGETLAPREGSQVLPDGKWYNLKFNYVDTNNKLQSGYAYFVGTEASWQYWDYICATPSNGPLAKFKKVSSEDSRMHLQTQDGNYLSCRAAPRLWLYRSSAYPVGWEIVGGKLFTDYHSGPVGAVYHGVMVPQTYYMCVGGPELTNCEWVEATD